MPGSSSFECEQDHERSTESLVVLRVNLRTDQEARQWLASYSEATHTSWIIEWTLPNAKRVVFHQKLLCQRSKRNKTSIAAGANCRCTNCPAFVHIKVKKLTRATKRSDPFLRRTVPLTAVVKLSQNHNHSLDGGQRFLRSTPATRALFNGYFQDGLTPAKAMALHLERLSAEDDALERLASGALNPGKTTVYYWYNIWRNQLSGELDPTVKLEEKATSYLRHGVDIKTAKRGDGSCWAVLGVTKIMKRTQQLAVARETVFLDSVSLVTATSTMTLLLAATRAGAIPLAVLLHGPRSMDSYATAFDLLKQSYPHCFGGAQAPRAFVMGTSSAEKDALRAAWPEVSHFLYPFDVVQAEWRWLNAAENKVDQEERRSLISSFQEIMYAESAEELEAATKELQAKSHRGYVDHVNAFLAHKTEWVLLFRHGVASTDDTNDFAEASVRILRDILLHSRKAYNLIALVDFVATVWEDYFKRRLLSYSRNRRPVYRLHHDKLLKRMPDSEAPTIEVVHNNVYRVHSGQQGNKVCEVFLDLYTCSCRTGQLGAFCRHQALVHRTYGGVFPDAPSLSAEDRLQLEFLALGVKSQAGTSFLELEGALSDQPASSAYSSEVEETTAPQGIPSYSSDQLPRSEPKLGMNCSTSNDQQHCRQKADELLEKIYAQLQKHHSMAVDSPAHLAVLEQIWEGMKPVEDDPGMTPCISDTETMHSSSRGQGIASGSKRTLAYRPSKMPSAKMPRRAHT